ncbi:Ankyrin repeats (3 copies) [Legionella busanensis]|uniref:Ankyrin repeats (3 copies) n=1 Tax=Legionella busanensis TaxID=190655 RepID=A0A378JVB0_9GAMM|nr:hypothetical protein [Legionella busanensis]STX52142.1 Ankyrin repeats (3 copies) [Legionella busanensis]
MKHLKQFISHFHSNSHTGFVTLKSFRKVDSATKNLHYILRDYNLRAFDSRPTNWDMLEASEIGRINDQKRFLSYLKQVDKILLTQVLNIKSSKNILLNSAKYAYSEPLIFLLQYASSKTLCEVTRLKNKNNDNLVILCAKRRDKSFICLLDKIDDVALKEVLLLRNKDGHNALTLAAKYQPEQSFIHLLEKLDNSFLNQKISIDDLWEFFMRAAEYQSEKGFKYLLEKIDNNLLNQVMNIDNNSTRWNILMCAARYQSSEAFQMLIEKIDKSFFKSNIIYTFNKNNESVLSLTLKHQDESALILLLSRLDRPTLEIIKKCYHEQKIQAALEKLASIISVLDNPYTLFSRKPNDVSNENCNKARYNYIA